MTSLNPATSGSTAAPAPQNEEFRAEVYDPVRHSRQILDYMAVTTAPNNRSAAALRLNDYNGETGDLFLILDGQDRIRAMTSVLVDSSSKDLAAKIYGRFHIDDDTPHWVIDRYFEPMTFDWCERRQIRNLFLTVNEGHLRVLDWVSRRMGERRNTTRENRYAPGFGGEKRSGFVPLNHLIFERHCWQYVIYYSPRTEWFLERDQKPLDPEAFRIFKREFSRATQNWPELHGDPQVP